MERLLQETQAALHSAGIDLELRGGAEVALGFLPRLGPDERRRFGLAGNPRYLLLEFPYEGWPLGIEATVESLRADGITAVLAPPERSGAVPGSPLQLPPAGAGGGPVAPAPAPP